MNSFSNSFIDFYSCEVVSWSDMRKNRFNRFVSIMAVVAKCLHFVMPYMKQNKKHKQTLESPQYGLEISFNTALFSSNVTPLEIGFQVSELEWAEFDNASFMEIEKRGKMLGFRTTVGVSWQRLMLSSHAFPLRGWGGGTGNEKMMMIL